MVTQNSIVYHTPLKRHLIRSQNSTHLLVFQILASSFFERYTTGLIKKTSTASSGSTAWQVQESPQLPAQLPADILNESTSELASSSHEAAEMLGTLASLSQALPCSLRAVCLLYVGIFPTLLRNIAILQVALSAISGSSSFSVHYRS